MTAHSAREDCPFCRIVANMAPAREVYRTADYLVILPDVPAVPGHVLVIPTVHVRDIWGLDEVTGQALLRATLHAARAVRAFAGVSDLNVIQSNGVAAGQSVFHLHIHVVPRTPGDRMPELWPVDADWPATELDGMAESLRVAASKEA